MSDADFVLEGRLIDLVDRAWHLDEVPFEDINIRPGELPELDPDFNDHFTAQEPEDKWSDLNLQAIQ